MCRWMTNFAKYAKFFHLSGEKKRKKVCKIAENRLKVRENSSRNWSHQFYRRVTCCKRVKNVNGSISNTDLLENVIL